MTTITESKSSDSKNESNNEKNEKVSVIIKASLLIYLFEIFIDIVEKFMQSNLHFLEHH